MDNSSGGNTKDRNPDLSLGCGGRTSVVFSNCKACLLTDKPVDCKRRNLVYEVHCQHCLDVTTGSSTSIYVGETSRALWERTSEHWSDFMTQKDKSHIAKHIANFHPNLHNPPDLKVSVVKYFQSALQRQVYEAVRIDRRAKEPGINIMNSKSEFNRCQLPRIIMEQQGSTRLH